MQQRRKNHWRDKNEKGTMVVAEKNHYNRYGNIRIEFLKTRERNIDVNEREMSLDTNFS